MEAHAPVTTDVVVYEPAPDGPERATLVDMLKKLLLAVEEIRPYTHKTGKARAAAWNRVHKQVWKREKARFDVQDKFVSLLQIPDQYQSIHLTWDDEMHATLLRLKDDAARVTAAAKTESALADEVEDDQHCDDSMSDESPALGGEEDDDVDGRDTTTFEAGLGLSTNFFFSESARWMESSRRDVPAPRREEESNSTVARAVEAPRLDSPNSKQLSKHLIEKGTNGTMLPDKRQSVRLAARRRLTNSSVETGRSVGQVSGDDNPSQKKRKVTIARQTEAATNVIAEAQSTTASVAVKLAKRVRGEGATNTNTENQADPQAKRQAVRCNSTVNMVAKDQERTNDASGSGFPHDSSQPSEVWSKVSAVLESKKYPRKTTYTALRIRFSRLAQLFAKDPNASRHSDVRAKLVQYCRSVKNPFDAMKDLVESATPGFTPARANNRRCHEVVPDAKTKRERKKPVRFQPSPPASRPQRQTPTTATANDQANTNNGIRDNEEQARPRQPAATETLRVSEDLLATTENNIHNEVMRMIEFADKACSRKPAIPICTKP